MHQGPGGIREENHPRLADQHHLGTHHEAQAAIAGMDKDSEPWIITSLYTIWSIKSVLQQFIFLKINVEENVNFKNSVPENLCQVD